MTLQPLLGASALVQIHTLAGLAAIVIGFVQLVRTKGTASHRAIGYVWIALLMVDAATAWLLYSPPGFRLKNPIHLLSVLAPLFVIAGILTARLQAIRIHAAIMILTYFLYMGVVFYFTFNPGRVMHRLLVG